MARKLWKTLFTLCDNVRDDMFEDISPMEKKSLLTLTPSHRKILIAVLELREMGVEPITLKDLADHVKLTPGTISPLVEKLVSKKLLERTQNMNDRRAVDIKLAKFGETLFQSTSAKMAFLSQCFEKVISEEEFNSFIEKIEILNQVVKENCSCK
ncbi:MAG: MarR family winged helix-turn-helix transcriptional regulator [Victivallaceae bacterium]